MTDTSESVPAPVETSTPRERSIAYIAAAVVVVALIVIGLLTFHAGKSNEEAQAKANQLIAELNAKGARAPSTEMIVGLLGDDGGAICADPNAALSKAALLSGLTNGAGGPGLRPVIAESRAVQAGLLVIKVYCPEELPKYEEFVNSLNLENTSNG